MERERRLQEAKESVLLCCHIYNSRLEELAVTGGPFGTRMLLTEVVFVYVVGLLFTHDYVNLFSGACLIVALLNIAVYPRQQTLDVMDVTRYPRQSAIIAFYTGNRTPIDLTPLDDHFIASLVPPDEAIERWSRDKLEQDLITPCVTRLRIHSIQQHQ